MRNEESEPCICRPCKGGGKAQYSKDDIVWYLPPLQGWGGVVCECGICKGGQTKYIFAANCFREAEQSQKIYIFGKKCIISAFFLQLSAKKNNKDYIKTLDTEQNADYTIMDWVY
mgnify:CR=1 FL=1